MLGRRSVVALEEARLGVCSIDEAFILVLRLLSMSLYSC